MGKNFFKYVCMIWTMSINIPAYNSLQPNFALNVPSAHIGTAEEDPNPFDYESYQSTNTKRRRLLEAINVDEESGFGTVSDKSKVKYLDSVPQNEEDDSVAVTLRKTEIESNNGENEESKVVMDSKTQKGSRETKSLNDLNERFHIRKVFDKFGDGDTMSYEGFERLLKKLGLQRLVSNDIEESSTNFATTEALRILNASSVQAYKSSRNNSNASNVNLVCLKSRDIFSDYISSRGSSEAGPQTGGASSGDERNSLSEDTLFHMCPSLLYQLTSATAREVEEGCFLVKEDERKDKPEINMGQVWLFSTLSIVGISLCGFVGVATVPIMQHELYHQLLHFLIAMAIGALCGDALLHLLPEAMASNEDQGHDALNKDVHSHDQDKTSKGFVAAVGIVIFFFFEQCLRHGGKWFKQRQRKKKILSRMLAKAYGRSSTQDEKTGKQRKSNYPYGYEEITNEVSGKDKNVSPANGHVSKMAEGQDLPMNIFVPDGEEQVGNKEGEGHELNNLKTESHSIVVREPQNDRSDHAHAHAHSHSHIHLGTDNTSTIAYMVIMGEGLDNFTDGIAIGAAFAASIAGGFSTVIAVFFHELPHELGDFAVLIKAGMSIKEVIFYNLMSSALCLLGMIGGVLLGQDESVLKWVFALAAGLFLYIALVDMMPELTRTHTSDKDKFVQLFLQLLGMVSGLGVMVLIASLEDQLQNLFSD